LGAALHELDEVDAADGLSAWKCFDRGAGFDGLDGLDGSDELDGLDG
jgi:hypothetical protein